MDTRKRLRNDDSDGYTDNANCYYDYTLNPFWRYVCRIFDEDAVTRPNTVLTGVPSDSSSKTKKRKRHHSNEENVDQNNGLDRATHINDSININYYLTTAHPDVLKEVVRKSAEGTALLSLQTDSAKIKTGHTGGRDMVSYVPWREGHTARLAVAVMYLYRPYAVPPSPLPSLTSAPASSTIPTHCIDKLVALDLIHNIYQQQGGSDAIRACQTNDDADDDECRGGNRWCAVNQSATYSCAPPPPALQLFRRNDMQNTNPIPHSVSFSSALLPLPWPLPRLMWDYARQSSDSVESTLQAMLKKK